MSLEKLIRNLTVAAGITAGVLGFNKSLEARTLRVPLEYSTIQLGVNAAVDDDTVLVAPGNYNENILIEDKAIILKSESGYDVTTVGTGFDYAINIPPGRSNLLNVVEGFSIIGTSALSPYQSIVEIKNNKLKTQSSAIAVTRGTVNILDNVILNNDLKLYTGDETNPGSVYLRGNTLIGHRLTIFGSGSLTYSNNIFYTTGTPIDPPSEIVSDPVINEGCNDFFMVDTPSVIFHPTDIFSNPLFCNESNDDYSLMENSPCLPENSNGCGLIGALGMNCGATPNIPTTFGRIKAMYK